MKNARNKVIKKDFQFNPPALNYQLNDSSLVIKIGQKLMGNKFSFAVWLFEGERTQTVYENWVEQGKGKYFSKGENSLTFKGIDLRARNMDSIWIHFYLTLEGIDLVDLNDKNRRNYKNQNEKVVYIAKPGGKLKPVGNWWKKKNLMIDYTELKKLNGVIKDSVEYEIDYLFGPPYEN